MRDVAFAFAGLGKEGFIYLDNAGKGIRVHRYRCNPPECPNLTTCS